MTLSKHAAGLAILATSTLLVAAPAQAFSARQASAQGQGTFVTSSGSPQNMMASGPEAQGGDDANRRPLRTSHHDRYFAGF